MRAVADTSVLIASEAGRSLDRSAMPDELAISMIVIGELRAGVLSAADPTVRSLRLDTLTRALRLSPIPVDDTVVVAWSELRVALRDAGRRMPVNDSWIAATALALGVPVVSQDDDYDDVPGLDVIRV
jgi:hypothetical protein